MKFFLNKKFLVLLPFIFLLFLIIICKPPKPSAFGLYRFTDNLTERNIIESPLKDILKSFKKTEEDYADRWTHLPSLSGKEQDVWAVSSQYPILGLDESEKPDGMKVTRDGKEIDFVTDTEKIDESWGWLSPTKRKKIRKYPQFSKKYGGIVLREGETFSFEELLLRK